MLKAMIVDDNILERMNLRMLIDWSNMGIELLEDGVDGMDALEKIQQYHPDIVILDIGMPVINGIEVIGKLKEIEYTGKIIVLSCHDEFESVKEAMKMGAFDYVLKHLLKKDSFISVINEAVEDLKKGKAIGIDKKAVIDINKMNLPIQKEKLVKDLISGNIREKSQLENELSKVNIHMTFNRYAVLLVEIDDMFYVSEKYKSDELNRILMSVNQVLQEALSKRDNCLLGCVGEGKYCVVISFEKSMSYMNMNTIIFEICENILSNIRSYINLYVSIGISRIYEDVAIANDSYIEARLALEGKLYLGKNRIIHFTEIEKFNQKLENFLKSYEEEIIKSVSADSSNIIHCISRIFSDIKRKNVRSEYIRVLCFELLSLANVLIKENGLGYSDIFGCDSIPYNYVMKFETLDDIEGWFLKTCQIINRELNVKINSSAMKIRPEIRKSLEFIERNFMKNITLKDISEYSGLSRTYFSQIFKSEMNETYTDYLGRYRIEKAKGLLKKADDKIYSVALACGFDTYRNFVRMFKELTGVSPHEYRQSMQK